MENQQNAIVEEDKHICKKCLQRLPNKSYYCMYCGTDNSKTSVQAEFRKTNNEALKKYTTIESKKKTVLWYMLFVLLLIDIIIINFILFTNNQELFVKVNNAKFENYEKTFYLSEDAYLAVKDNKIRVIGSNRLDYIDAISEIQLFEFKDIQEVPGPFNKKTIYFQTTKNIIYALESQTIKKIETNQEYIDIYHYLNDMASNCYESTENFVLGPGYYYYDIEKEEVIQLGQANYTNNGTKVCATYPRTTIIDNKSLSLENPEVLYHSSDGKEIILKGNKEIVIISLGQIKDRYTELNINGETIKVEDIKKVFYENKKYTIIDKKNDIYIGYINRENTVDKESSLSSTNEIFNILNIEDKDTKINLIILLVLLITDLVFLYKMSEKHTFSKCMTMSGLLMIEYILYTVFRGGGFELNSGAEFLALLEMLFIEYLLIIIVSTVIVQIAELADEGLELIKFKNVFSFILTFAAIMSVFLNILTASNYGIFFSVFLLGSYWSYFSETEDIDIDLFITASSNVPIIVLSIINVVLYFIIMHIFKINNYFVFLLLITIVYALYLAVRPELTKKELTGKSIKSLLVIIMSLAYNFILSLFAMNLFNKLVKDDGTIMKYVLMMGLEYILYLVVTFILLIIISSILRILHKIIKKVCKNTNTIVMYLIFSLISLLLFSLIVYFFPEIINLINTGVNQIFTLIK